MTATRPSKWFVIIPPDGAARSVGEEVHRAFTRCIGGESVKAFDCKTYLQAFSGMLKKNDETMVVDLLNHALIVQCLDFKATNLLVLALSPVTLFTLNLLRAQRVTTAHWFYEDFRRALYWKEVLAGYDYFFAIQKGPIEDECIRNGSRYLFLPTAAHPHAIFEQTGTGSRPPGGDVAFVGIPSPYRVRVLEALVSRGISVAVAGVGWNQYQGPLCGSIVKGDWIDAPAAAAIVSDGKIGLNLSVVDPEEDRRNTPISPRVFDILQSGRVLVTESVPLLPVVLPDFSYRTFANQEECCAVIEDVLSHQQRETACLEKNRDLVRTRHRYENRVVEIISRIGTESISGFPGRS